jgi:uncharacterized membrane protein
MTHDEFIALLDEPAVVAAIRAAEARSTGEIRVLVAHEVVGDALAEARQRFARLGMTRTAARNGVLLLVAPCSRAFAVVGDEGIQARGGDALWSRATTVLGDHFRRGEWTSGVVSAIALIGDALARHFPRDASASDQNELPDALLRDHPQDHTASDDSPKS